MPEKDYLILNGERVSTETLKSPNVPPPAKRRKPLWLRLVLQHPIWTYLIVVGGIAAILSHYWRAVEKVSPPLNEFIHRDVSDKNDADYQLYKLRQSQQRYLSGVAICDKPDTAFAACRSAMLASKPALTDMENRVLKLEVGWQREFAAKPMPHTCRDARTALYNSLEEYVTHERQVSDVFEAADPNSTESVAKAKEQLDQLVPIEEQAVQRLKSLPPWPKECADF